MTRTLCSLAALAWLACATAGFPRPAVAADPTVFFRSETVAQLRQNFYGSTELPFYQYLVVDAGERDGTLGASAFLGLDYVFGAGEGDVDLYLADFRVRDRGGRGHLIAGRQLVRFPTRMSAMDGLWANVRPHRNVSLETWVGAGRHMDLDDFLDGEFVAGVRASLVGVEPVAASAGGHLARAPQESFRAVVEAQALVRPRARFAPRPYALLQLSPEVARVRQARGGLRLSPLPWANLDLHGGYRTATDATSLFGEQILGAIASDGMADAGLKLAVRAGGGVRIGAGYDFTFYTLSDGSPAPGHGMDAHGAVPVGDRATLAGRYAFRHGPGGSYHATGLLASTALHRRVDLDLQATLAPYRKPGRDWALAFHGNADVAWCPVEPLSVRLGVDVASDIEYALDLRGMVTVVVEETFRPRRQAAAAATAEVSR